VRGGRSPLRLVRPAPHPRPTPPTGHPRRPDPHTVCAGEARARTAVRPTHPYAPAPPGEHGRPPPHPPPSAPARPPPPPPAPRDPPPPPPPGATTPPPPSPPP